MGKVNSIVIDEQLNAFVGEQINRGLFETADDVVEAALRLLQKQEAELEAIRAAIIEGEESGDPQPFDFETFVERKRAEPGYSRITADAYRGASVGLKRLRRSVMLLHAAPISLKVRQTKRLGFSA